ncbi:AraC family transcriptional regulator [Thermoactinospora rubra]|uniref:AraC family transcriptional regulator n=1 Tax=Thermoactinospora rubra TaxID=1088767 RepID=UPI000A0F736F|nr:helix-turn-helix domain-containing protein [Thermoactinospora rubra]
MNGLLAVERAPLPALRPYVTRLIAYREGVPVERIEYPFPGAVLVLGFEAPTEVNGMPYASFGHGLGDRPAVTRVRAAAEGVEVMLTPFGARRLYGAPMAALTNLTVPVEDLLGAWTSPLVERLAETRSWEERLRLTERFLLKRVMDGPEIGGQVPWAWGRLVASGGRVAVSDLARELGWSHRHLVARFHDAVGLAPKAAARLIRFDRALALLRGGMPPAEVAAACGYYDQAHLNRDFRAFAGGPPGTLRS